MKNLAHNVLIAPYWPVLNHNKIIIIIIIITDAEIKVTLSQ